MGGVESLYPLALPRNEVERIDQWRKTAARDGGRYTKSEVVRAALAAAADMPADDFRAYLDKLVRLRPGRK